MQHPVRIDRQAPERLRRAVGLPAAATLIAAVTLMTIALGLGLAARARAATIEEQALAAAQRGAQWIASQQESDGDLGGFGGDWSMTALASAGINAADVRTSLVDPSAQDFYYATWSTEGPGGAATDAERAILSGHAGGLQPARLAAQRNLVADLATQFDGHELGGKGATNADIFGLLALDASGGPSDVAATLAESLHTQQDPDGGWNFAAGAATSDVDMTGAGIAALCAAGATPADPALARALAFLHKAQDPATGGFVSATLGLNTDTTGWVLSGLRRCGLDPQSWVSSGGKTPLDFLLSQQNPDGSFQWQAGDENEDLYATQDAVRPLAGAAFTAPAPPRADGTSPAIRPAPSVTAGTPIAMTLVIDSGRQVTGGSSLRMCKITAPQGATVAEALQDADAASSPAYCVSDLAFAGDRIARLNGLGGQPGQSVWQVSRDGGPAETSTAGTLGLGALVQVQLVSAGGESESPSPTGSPSPPPAPAGSIPTAAPHLIAPRPPARLRLRAGALTHVHGGRLTVKLSCPDGTGAEGCRGLVRVQARLRLRPGGPLRIHTVGEAEVHLAAGSSGSASIALSHALRHALHLRKDRLVSIVAAMRDPRTGAATSVAAQTVLR